jgi:hypothetical protein
MTPYEGSDSTVEDGRGNPVPPSGHPLGSPAMTGHTLVLPPPRS